MDHKGKLTSEEIVCVRCDNFLWLFYIFSHHFETFIYYRFETLQHSSSNNHKTNFVYCIKTRVYEQHYNEKDLEPTKLKYYTKNTKKFELITDYIILVDILNRNIFKLYLVIKNIKVSHELCMIKYLIYCNIMFKKFI